MELPLTYFTKWVWNCF